MFGRIMNNYYYGKSGKGDFRKEDMPGTRMQLFWDMLRVRLSGLCRINLLYALIFLPMMVVIMLSVSNIYENLNVYLMIHDNDYQAYAEQMKSAGAESMLTEAEFQELASQEADIGKYLETSLQKMLLLLVPCIAITGPFTAGLSYVTRNWARDEHAFIWSDFKDAVKENWKYSLVISCVTGFLPLAVFEGWIFYGQMATTNLIMFIPQILVVMVGAIWSISVTYMYPITVTYDLKLKGVLRNALLLAIARLPFSVGIRLLHLVPLLIGFIAVWFFGLNLIVGLMILGGYYILIGFALSRFITASYTNAVFDRFINSRIEGAKTNRGMRIPDEDEDETGTIQEAAAEPGKE